MSTGPFMPVIRARKTPDLLYHSLHDHAKALGQPPENVVKSDTIREFLYIPPTTFSLGEFNPGTTPLTLSFPLNKPH